MCRVRKTYGQQVDRVREGAKVRVFDTRVKAKLIEIEHQNQIHENSMLSERFSFLCLSDYLFKQVYSRKYKVEIFANDNTNVLLS